MPTAPQTTASALGPLLALLLLAPAVGCFDPDLKGVRCGADDTCPPGLDCIDGACLDESLEPASDGAPDDAPVIDAFALVDAPDTDGALSRDASLPDAPAPDAPPIDAAPAPLGASCTTGTECASGHCADDVCCDDACDGVCQKCGTDGRCNLMPADDTDCGTIDCDGLDTTCRDYHDLTSNRCLSFGECKPPNETATCEDYTDAPTDVLCRDDGDKPCDVPEYCDGQGKCPADALATKGTQCRAADGDCDAAETCTGNSKSCPADEVRPANVVCREGGPCTLDARCDGQTKSCPDNPLMCPEPNSCCLPEQNVCQTPCL